MPTKVYAKYVTQTLATGEVKRYLVHQKYEAKDKPNTSPERIAEMKKLLEMGVKKKIVCEKFGLSYTTLMKYIKD